MSQGRIPPANAPQQPQWRHPTDAERAAEIGQGAHPGWPAQPPVYPTQARPQPPAIPHPAQRQAGAEPAWSPAPPEPFPTLPQHVQQQPGYPQAAPYAPAPRPIEQLQPSYGYPAQHIPQPAPPQPQGQFPPQGQSHAQTEAARAEAWRRAQEQQQQRSPDPAAYDLGSYAMPTNAPAQGRPTGRDARQPPPPPPDAQTQWAPQPVDPYQVSHQQQGYPQHAAVPQPQGYGAEYGYQQPAAGVPMSQQQEQYPEDEVEYEEPPRRSRRWLIVGALIGSIGLGGGMAYAYKYFVAPKAGDKAQVVRAPREPAKIAPSDRGGKQMAGTDSKLMNRLPSEGSSNAAGGAVAGLGESDNTGVRRVQTIPVGRDMVPIPTSGAAAAGVPGMTIVSGNNLPGAGGPPGSPFDGAGRGGMPMQQPPPRVAAATPPPMPPQPPRQPVAAKAQPVAPGEAAPAAPRAIVPKQVAATPAAERTKPTGHVAVLGYQRSQLDAMKMMADLQQKYEGLRDRKLEIIQSDETPRGLGVIYRIVVGPRSSIAAAREVCTQLQQSGMPPKSCYTLAN